MQPALVKGTDDKSCTGSPLVRGDHGTQALQIILASSRNGDDGVDGALGSFSHRTTFAYVARSAIWYTISAPNASCKNWSRASVGFSVGGSDIRFCGRYANDSRPVIVQMSRATGSFA